MDKKDITSIAIGRFDGLHLGHYAIFKNLTKNGAIVVIEDDRDKLTPVREKFLNIPFFYYYLKDIKHLSGDEFLNIIKKDFINLQKIVVGYDFKFGNNRNSSASDLKSMFGGEICIVSEYKIDGISVHSRKIRECILDGNLTKANHFLGRLYSIRGRVIKGQGLGKKELFATLNLDTNGYILPKNGVYATYTIVDNIKYKSVSFIGNRVSTDGKFSIETHILDSFNQDIKDYQVEILFAEMIRENFKFDKLENLKKQIDIDIKKAKEILNER